MENQIWRFGSEGSQALRELEQENSKLKRMVANLMLEKEAIEEALKKL